jgi:hypothetical protein
LEQGCCFSGRGHCFPSMEVLLALYNFLLCTVYKPDAKIKNLPVGLQSSGPLNLCLFIPFLSPSGSRTSDICDPHLVFASANNLEKNTGDAFQELWLR